MNNNNKPNRTNTINILRRIPVAIEVTIALENENGDRIEEIFQVNIRPPLGEGIIFDPSY